jgi:hypothetical protein
MLKVYGRILGGTWRALGVSRELFKWIFFIPFYYALTYLTLALDHVFFPHFRKVEVKRPIFLIGYPRSGTTFVHRSLTESGEFCVFRVWHLIFPALTARLVVRPIVERLISRGKDVILPASHGHETKLGSVEEEDALFFPLFDSLLITGFSALGFHPKGHDLDIALCDDLPHRMTSIRHFKRCLQRQILYTGRSQVIAKMPVSTVRIKTLLEAFPDARFIYMVRSPLETVPSLFSFNMNIYEHRWGPGRISQTVLDDYFHRRYRASLNLYTHFYEAMRRNEIPRDQVLIIPYARLRRHWPEILENIKQFGGIEFSPVLQDQLVALAEGQKSYARGHRNKTLADFNLTEDQVRKDLAFLFEGQVLTAGAIPGESAPLQDGSNA